MARDYDGAAENVPARTKANGAPPDMETPPIEAYGRDPEIILDATAPPQHVESARYSPITIRAASDVAAILPQTAWRLRPYLERDALVFFYGDYGTYKSFVVIDWSMRVALGLSALGYGWPSEQCAVVLISAEGRALPHRLRAWCIRNFPGEDFRAVLGRASLYCIERPVNLSDPQSALALIVAIEELKITPGLIVIDTMSRNSDGRVEESTATANTYLTIIDQSLRSRYRCTVVLTHHVGHEKSRMRGPITLAANTDALIRIDRPDPEQRRATLTVERLKDSEEPVPQGLSACIVELGERDAEGQPITSLALESEVAMAAPSVDRPELRGKAQRQLLAALRAQDDSRPIWTIHDIREIGRKACIRTRRDRPLKH